MTVGRLFHADEVIDGDDGDVDAPCTDDYFVLVELCELHGIVDDNVDAVLWERAIDERVRGHPFLHEPLLHLFLVREEFYVDGGVSGRIPFPA